MEKTQNKNLYQDYHYVKYHLAIRNRVAIQEDEDYQDVGKIQKLRQDDRLFFPTPKEGQDYGRHQAQVTYSFQLTKTRQRAAPTHHSNLQEIFDLPFHPISVLHIVFLYLQYPIHILHITYSRQLQLTFLYHFCL